METWKEIASGQLPIPGSLNPTTSRGQGEGTTAFGSLDQSVLPPLCTVAEVDEVIAELETLFQSTRPPLPTRKRRKVQNVPWWSQEIASLCLQAKRFRHRWQKVARRDPTAARQQAHPYRVEMLESRRALSLALRRAKEASWGEMVSTIEEDPWGKPYKAVMNRLKGKMPLIRLNREEFHTTVSTLFVVEQEQQEEAAVPRGSATEEGEGEEARGIEAARASLIWPCQEGASTSSAFDGRDIVGAAAGSNAAPSNTRERCQNPGGGTSRQGDVFVNEDVRYAMGMLKKGKAPGPDEIPGEAVHVLRNTASGWVCALFNSCLRLGYFPKAWKVGRLALIPKAGKACNSLSDLRPLCMLSDLGKCFEYALRVLMLEAIRLSGGLSVRQFGFMEGRSTHQAMKVVMSEWDRARRGRNHCLLITLDVKNAFNTVRWDRILTAAEHRGFPTVIMNMLRSYLSERRVGTRTPSGEWVEAAVFGGVPQGSVLGPLLWNLSYDGLLEVFVATGCDDRGICG
ncbi:uncharacterized protein LOC114881775 [Osmia bicornis bicornis]|uniref:uncharacterized protein LOC114881775 n=1 Tax=Osmia bicornis bicornis TaxID=1437191 RepID=UPI001EAEE467|nr:uncharacterized protein LOC114881775 [Osmia bicornis bicornis]